jgi:ribosomal protein S17E
MKEYKERFIWNKFINKLKEDFKENISGNLNEMIIDSSDGEDINRNNEEMMPKYNSLYNENFLDDNDMILDD